MKIAYFKEFNNFQLKTFLFSEHFFIKSEKKHL